MTLRRTGRKGVEVFFEDDKGQRYRVIWIAIRRRLSQPALAWTHIGITRTLWDENSLLAPPLAEFEALITDKDRAYFLAKSMEASR